MARSIVRTTSRQRRRGLSMVEALISLAIVAMLLSAVAGAFAASGSAIEQNDRFFRASQAARISLNQILSEVRKCRSATEIDTTHISILTDAGETHIYDLDTTDPDNGKLTLAVKTPTLPYPVYRLASHVKSLVLECTDDATISMLITVEVGNNTVTLSGSAMPRRNVEYK